MKTSQEAISGIDPYLGKALREVKANLFPRAGYDERLVIQGVVDEIMTAAAQQKHYALDDDTARAIGIYGIREIAPLLAEADPNIRCMAAEALFVMHRRRSVPFLVGLLTDTAKVNRAGQTVSSLALQHLGSAINLAARPRVPTDEFGQKMAHEKAIQRWCDYHIPFCSWQDRAGHSRYELNELALYSGVPPEALEWAKKEFPERVGCVVVVWPFDSRTAAVYKAGSPVRLTLVFQNFGSEPIGIRQDMGDRSVHVLRLVGPDGQDVPADEQEIPARPAPFQLSWPDPSQPAPLREGRGALHWKLQLNQVYDLSKTGPYRLHYSYVPPADAREDEYSKPLELRFWNGREYVNYYELLIADAGKGAGLGNAGRPRHE